jgi:type 1 glutamine amidotransferase
MPTIDYRAPVNVLVSVRGHPFDRTAFDAIFQGMTGLTATVVDQPAAAQLMTPEGLAPYDALVLYDMPGLDFGAPEHAPAYVEPPAALKAGLRAVLEAGKGVVALHHALAGWPAWPEYGEWLGGRFLYHPGTVRGRACLDSGYAHGVTHEIRVLAAHPVTAGVAATFTLTDEPYLAEVFAEDVVPLLASSHAFVKENFYSAALAVAGKMYARDGWEHPPGPNLVGWAKRALNAPLVYLQPGDGKDAYDAPEYRRLVENAIRWVASAEARTWARAR